MATYATVWRVEFDADSDDEAREAHARILEQTDEVDASIYHEAGPWQLA